MNSLFGGTKNLAQKSFFQHSSSQDSKKFFTMSSPITREGLTTAAPSFNKGPTQSRSVFRTRNGQLKQSFKPGQRHFDLNLTMARQAQIGGSLGERSTEQLTGIHQFQRVCKSKGSSASRSPQIGPKLLRPQQVQLDSSTKQKRVLQNQAETINIVNQNRKDPARSRFGTTGAIKPNHLQMTAPSKVEGQILGITPKRMGESFEERKQSGHPRHIKQLSSSTLQANEINQERPEQSRDHFSLQKSEHKTSAFNQKRSGTSFKQNRYPQQSTPISGSDYVEDELCEESKQGDKLSDLLDGIHLSNSQIFLSDAHYHRQEADHSGLQSRLCQISPSMKKEVGGVPASRPELKKGGSALSQPKFPPNYSPAFSNSTGANRDSGIGLKQSTSEVNSLARVSPRNPDSRGDTFQVERLSQTINIGELIQNGRAPDARTWVKQPSPSTSQMAPNCRPMSTQFNTRLNTQKPSTSLQVSSTTIVPQTPVEHATNLNNAKFTMKSAKKSPCSKRSSSAMRTKNYLKPTKASELRQTTTDHNTFMNLSYFLRRGPPMAPKAEMKSDSKPRQSLNSHTVRQPMIITSCDTSRSKQSHQKQTVGTQQPKRQLAGVESQPQFVTPGLLALPQEISSSMTVISESDDTPIKQAHAPAQHHYQPTYKSKSPYQSRKIPGQILAQQVVDGHFLSRKFFDQFKVQMVQTQQKNQSTCQTPIPESPQKGNTPHQPVETGRNSETISFDLVDGESQVASAARPNVAKPTKQSEKPEYVSLPASKLATSDKNLQLSSSQKQIVMLCENSCDTFNQMSHHDYKTQSSNNLMQSSNKEFFIKLGDEENSEMRSRSKQTLLHQHSGKQSKAHKSSYMNQAFQNSFKYERLQDPSLLRNVKKQGGKAVKQSDTSDEIRRHYQFTSSCTSKTSKNLAEEQKEFEQLQDKYANNPSSEQLKQFFSADGGPRPEFYHRQNHSPVDQYNTYHHPREHKEPAYAPAEVNESPFSENLGQIQQIEELPSSIFKDVKIGKLNLNSQQSALARSSNQPPPSSGHQVYHGAISKYQSQKALVLDQPAKFQSVKEFDCLEEEKLMESKSCYEQSESSLGDSHNLKKPSSVPKDLSEVIDSDDENSGTSGTSGYYPVAGQIPDIEQVAIDVAKPSNLTADGSKQPMSTSSNFFSHQSSKNVNNTLADTQKLNPLEVRLSSEQLARPSQFKNAPFTQEHITDVHNQDWGMSGDPTLTSHDKSSFQVQSSLRNKVDQQKLNLRDKLNNYIEPRGYLLSGSENVHGQPLMTLSQAQEMVAIIPQPDSNEEKSIILSETNNSAKLLVSQLSGQEDNFSKISENFMLSSSPKVIQSQLKQIRDEDPQSTKQSKQLLISPPHNYFNPQLINTDATKAQMLILDEEGVKSNRQPSQVIDSSLGFTGPFYPVSETEKINMVSQMSRVSPDQRRRSSPEPGEAYEKKVQQIFHGLSSQQEDDNLRVKPESSEEDQASDQFILLNHESQYPDTQTNLNPSYQVISQKSRRSLKSKVSKKTNRSRPDSSFLQTSQNQMGILSKSDRNSPRETTLLDPLTSQSNNQSEVEPVIDINDRREVETQQQTSVRNPDLFDQSEQSELNVLKAGDSKNADWKSKYQRSRIGSIEEEEYWPEAQDTEPGPSNSRMKFQYSIGKPSPMGNNMRALEAIGEADLEELRPSNMVQASLQLEGQLKEKPFPIEELPDNSLSNEYGSSDISRSIQITKNARNSSSKKLPFAYQPHQPASGDDRMEIEVEKYEDQANEDSTQLVTPNLTPIQHENYRQIMHPSRLLPAASQPNTLQVNMGSPEEEEMATYNWSALTAGEHALLEEQSQLQNWSRHHLLGL